MRKNRILAIVLSSAVLLVGCGRISDNDTIPKLSYSSSDYQSAPDISSPDSSFSVGDNSADSSSEESSAEESSSSNSIIEEPSEKTEGEYKIILDPINERTILCEGNEITLTGKMVSGFKPSVNIPHSETYRQSGGYFTYNAVIQDGYTGYGNITIFNNIYVRIYVSKGEVTFVQSGEAFEANEKAVKNAISQPLNQVSEYIAINADKSKIAEILGEITKISNEICAGLTNDYDKLRAISKWVSANIYYDYLAFDAGVPAETITLDYMLKNSSSVCGGYSNMTSALAAVQGIKVYNVHGSAVNNNLTFGEKAPAYHEWNYAVINGRVIWIDAGWNSHCYRYRNGKYERGEVTVKYFDISADALAQNHKANYAEYRDYFALLEE